jgi:uncharacterized membrane protein YesL
VALALELLVVKQNFMWGFLSLIGGVIVALFPSNYEIVGMAEDEENES